MIYNKSLPWKHLTGRARRGAAGNQLNLGGDVKVRGVIRRHGQEHRCRRYQARITLRAHAGQGQGDPGPTSRRACCRRRSSGRSSSSWSSRTTRRRSRCAGRRHDPRGPVAHGDRDRQGLQRPAAAAADVAAGELNRTLYALAKALERRGNALGNNLALGDRYFAPLNPNLPTINHDISGLADLANSLGDAAPDLLRLARPTAVSLTRRSWSPKQDALVDVLQGAPRASRTPLRLASSATTRTTSSPCERTASRFSGSSSYYSPRVPLPAPRAHRHPASRRGHVRDRSLPLRAPGTARWQPDRAYRPQASTNHRPTAARTSTTRFRQNGTDRPSCAGLPQPGVKYTYPHPDVASRNGQCQRGGAEHDCVRRHRADRFAGGGQIVNAIASAADRHGPARRPDDHRPAARAVAPRIGGEPAMNTLRACSSSSSSSSSSRPCSRSCSPPRSRTSRCGNTRTYHARFTDATGLNSGDDVRVAGVKVGQVTHVAIVDKRYADVTFAVKKNIRVKDVDASRRSGTSTSSASATSR